jgi:RNA polymerase sporulation-specific sigma factor
LVAHIAKKYSNYNDQDELISVGSIGLIKAINCYEPNKGTTLATYAAKCIENEMLMALRSGKKHSNNISINDVIGTDKDGNTLSLKDIIIDSGGDVEDAVSYKMGKERLIKVLKKLLDEREFTIMKHRYGLESAPARTQKEVAAALGISRSYVSRIEKKVIGRLRGYFRGIEEGEW